MTRALAETGFVYGCWRRPFADGPGEMIGFRPGITLARMIDDMPVPPDFARRGNILIAGHAVGRAHWHRVRLKPGQVATFHYPLAGGGGGSGSKRGVLSLVVAVAGLALSLFTLGGGFAFLGAAFKAGALGAKLLAGAISLGTSLLSRALAPPPVRPQVGQAADTKGPASLQGNVLAAGAPIPAVVGTFRVFPPLACQPLVERIGEDEIVEGLFVLAGPHAISAIRVGEASIADADGIDYQLRNGFADDAPVDLIQRYGVTQAKQIELSTHRVTADDQQMLDDQVTPETSLPKWHAVRASDSTPDEIWLHLDLPGGLYNTATSGKFTVPFRFRMRASDEDAWIDLPELHFSAERPRPLRLSVVLKWAAAPETVSTVPSGEGWTATYTAVAGQDTPPSDAWAADSSFYAGSGATVLYRGNEGTTGVRRVQLASYAATLFLDENAITKGGGWQIEASRGAVFASGSYDKSSHQYSGTARDFFSYTLSGGTAQVLVSRANMVDQVLLTRVVSVVNASPLPLPGRCAAIAVKATNQAIESLSCLAARYVPDWDGSAWTGLTTTSNPAPHFRDVMRGRLTPDPLDEELIDDTSLVAWRSACVTNGWTVDFVAEGDQMQSVLTMIASAGYAQPRMSETWGVARDYDRSAEDPVQVFTPRNSQGLSVGKAFPRLPDAFRVIWNDASRDYAERQEIVWRSGREATPNPRIEEIRYDALTDRTDALARAAFDLRQGEARQAQWNFKAPTEAIVATRGDLIAVNHDMLSRVHGGARIVDVERDSDGKVSGVFLDQKVPVYAEPDWFAVDDFFAVDDVFLLGVTSALGIRRSDGSQSVHVLAGATASSDFVSFATPVSVDADDDDGLPLVRPDNMVWIGEAGREVRRLIVTAIDFDSDLTASIAAVDEAPELWT